MGSVKDLIVIKEPTEVETGIGHFIFSDRYSVFDWGEMPDHIPDKGKAICMVTAYFFEKLEQRGIKTHYLGVVENGTVKRLNEVKEPSDTFQFKMVRVVKPAFDGKDYNYSVFKTLKSNFLIPLEVIYRNWLPEGSSLLKRLQKGEWKPEDVGLSQMPQAGQKLEKAILDFSTKLEITDRYIKEEEALEISGLTKEEFCKLKETAFRINEIITEEVSKFGLTNEDGKFEFALDEGRNLMVVDAVGALDECRFTYNGTPISKEILRIFYRETEWYRETEKAKKEDRQNWKNLVKCSPPPLPQEWKELISYIYKSYTNEITGRKFFDVPPLRELLSQLEKLIGRIKK
uniref:Phosphoribosylaminoimidazole-succinocarboxamide synthase n=1 Tax=candidate division WOR-3 bacterium TaxID=2052148 RepID=A0A7C2K3D1_UNCW3